MSNFKMPTAYNPSNTEWVRPIESLTSDGVRELQRLKDENAKLRELVDGLEYCVRGSVCDCCCPLYDPSGTNHRRCESLERELGVEVEDGTE